MVAARGAQAQAKRWPYKVADTPKWALEKPSEKQQAPPSKPLASPVISYTFNIPDAPMEQPQGKLVTNHYSVPKKPTTTTNGMPSFKTQQGYNEDRIGHKLSVNLARPLDAPMLKEGVVPSRTVDPLKSHVPSTMGTISGFKKPERTFVPSREGVSIAEKLALMRQERDSEHAKRQAAWKSKSGRPLTFSEKESLQLQMEDEAREFEVAKEEKVKSSSAHKKEAKEQKRLDRREKRKQLAIRLKEKIIRKQDEKAAKKLAKAEEKKRLIRIKNGEEDASDDGDGSTNGGGSDLEESVNTSDSEEEVVEEEDAQELIKKKEEEAMRKAEEGDFVADICVVCAFGLPKVDYW
jgi:hypothetical protein